MRTHAERVERVRPKKRSERESAAVRLYSLDNTRNAPYRRSIFLSLPEAQVLLGELAQVVSELEREAIAARNRPPEPPLASAAALEAA